ncbi:MAG: tetratricopeptide repeat protein [Planctomycetota bacterium]|jgi:tetratricopeptide (TPR) repeat protein
MYKRAVLLPLVLLVLVFGLPGPGLTDTAGQLEQAEQLQEQGKLAEAEAIYKAVAEANPGTYDGLAAQEKLTILHVESGKYAEAEGAYKQLLSGYSRVDGIAKAVDHVGDAYRGEDQYQKALGAYRHVVETWPQAENAASSQMNVAIIRIVRGEKTAAQAAIEELIAKFADDAYLPHALENIAEKYFDLEQYGPAKQWYEYVVENWPEAEYALWAQAGVASSNILLGNESAAQAAIDDLLGNYPDREGVERALEELGDSFSRRGRCSKAVGQQNRRAIWVQRSLARCYVMLADEPNATAATDRLLSEFAASDGLPRALRQLADSYRQMGNREKARELYRYVVADGSDPEEVVWAQVGLVRSLVSDMEYDAAETETLRLIGEFADSEIVAEGVHEIVEGYYYLGEHEQGKKLYEYYLAYQEGDADTRLELQVGVVLSEIGLEDDSGAAAAIEKLTTDFADHPKLAKGLLQIGEKYLTLSHEFKSQGLDDKYKQYVQKAAGVWQRSVDELATTKWHEETCYFLGKAYQFLGEYELAIPHFERVVADWPQSKVADLAQYSIARCWHALKVKERVARDEANERIKQAVEKLILDYPGSPAVNPGINLMGGPDNVDFDEEGEDK